MKSVSIQSRISRNRAAIALFLVGLLIVCVAAFGGGAPQARASYSAQPALLQADQTPTTGSSDTAPTPEPTALAALTATAGAVNPVTTGQPAPVSTGAAPGSGLGPSDTTPIGGVSGNTSGGSPGGGFPWLIVIGVILLVLAGLGFALLRPKRQTAAVATSIGTAAGPATTATTTTKTTAAPPAPVAVPATVTCPNCGTVNTTDEKFCHECGQDLRPLIAQVTQVSPAAGAGAAAPVDVVGEDTPYLETMDRADEQLEYVLSRPRIAIGTAAGNDIIVDSAFKNWETVSPRHAELLKEQDGFVIMDKDSQNGTFVNEMRTGENILSDGDLVRLGDVRFIFRVPQAGQ